MENIQGFDYYNVHGIDVFMSKEPMNFPELTLEGMRIATEADMDYIEFMSEQVLGDCTVWLQNPVSGGYKEAGRFVHIGCGGSCNYGWAQKKDGLCRTVFLSQTTEQIHDTWIKTKFPKQWAKIQAGKGQAYVLADGTTITTIMV